jgi:eukaryotic-like serine/threonine-protein kinase
MNAKAIKAGTFKPGCTKCKLTFSVVVMEPITDDAVFYGSLLPTPTSTKPNSVPAANVSAQTSKEATKQNNQSPPETTRIDASEPRESVGAQQTRPTDETRVDALDSVRDLQKNRHGSQRSNTSKPVGAEWPQQLGGYRLISELGRGGLGVVFLAKQLSLQREVALKVIRSSLAKNAGVVARFVREAYAAAQLTHHNIVQIYDLGSDGDTNYFSMEFVQGQNLADFIKEKGRLSPEQAAKYIIQAARGLQFAHNQGMVHRDIKPANLMLNNAGVIKVADLGLVKVPENNRIGSDEQPLVAHESAEDDELTVVGTTLGTANYMAPEQAEDASSVDHRADIYSLGCTFYLLLTGTPPYLGKSMAEVISKHRSEPLPNIISKVENVPPEIEHVIKRMMAKDLNQRYQDIGGVIADLEKFLGLESDRVFSPKESERNELKSAFQEYNDAPLGLVRRWTPVAFLGFVTVLVLTLVVVNWRWILPAIVFGASAPIVAAALRGLHAQRHWMNNVRQLLWMNRWTVLVRFGVISILLAAISWLLGVFGLAVFSLVLGIAAGYAFHFVVDRVLERQRSSAITRVENLLFGLRESGVGEDSIQSFVAKYSPEHWEEFFEDLFGYSAKIRARENNLKIAGGMKKRKYKAWIEPLIHRLDDIVESKRLAGDREKILKIEKAALRQEGLSEADAEAQADYLAEAMVSEAAQWKKRALASDTAQSPPNAAAIADQKRERFRKMMAEARSGKRAKFSLMKSLDSLLNPFLGAPVRLALGACLLIGFAFWVNANVDLTQVSQGEATSAAKEIISSNGEAASQIADRVGVSRLLNGGQQLDWPIVGSRLSSFASLVAGLILFGSGLVGGWRMTLFALPAAAIALFPDVLGIPDLTFLGGRLVLSTLIALGLTTVGFLFRE